MHARMHAENAAAPNPETWPLSDRRDRSRDCCRDGLKYRPTCVLIEPIADHHLCSRQALRGNILPFLRTADTGSERAVIHCWGGNGRTGHVLAAWLVAARGLSPVEAITVVEATGRLPQEAVLAGNATLDELIELLASCEPDRAA